MSKIAVVLLNLGGPQSLGGVRKFLFNLFYDKQILRLPNPFRWILAHIISIARRQKAQSIYKLLGGKSPIVEETLKQAEKLQKALENQQSEYKVFICMKHSEPNINDLKQKIKEFNPDKMIGLPLYPQFSCTTTFSAINEIKDTFKNIETKFIGCFFNEPNFIESQIKLINEAISQINIEKSIVIFSAHSLPVKIIEQGDPYQFQVEETVKLILEKLPKINYVIAYQSKLGPVEWLKPSTEDEITKAAEKSQDIVLVPISFVSEHSETLVELDIEYAEIVKGKNIKYVRVPTTRTHEDFIQSLKQLVLNASKQEKQISSATGKRICDQKFKYCLCN